MDSRCASIKSKKNPTAKCSSPATHGEFCSRHWKSKVRWTADIPRRPFTRAQTSAGMKIRRFLCATIRPRIRTRRGPAVFTPTLSHNDTDLYSLESITTIPLLYHFSYSDSASHVWTFDIRFLVECMQYGEALKNPFSQELFTAAAVTRFHANTQWLRSREIPLLYLEKDTLTPDQAWNQKVIEVFLKMSSLGYAINITWFESLNVRGHALFYRNLYNLWNTVISLSPDGKDIIVPGHNTGRTPLFHRHPIAIEFQGNDIKWWRKQTLSLINTFITRNSDRAIQGCGALYILTAFANTHPRVAEAYPWLVAE
jgi:hypothetical protein